MTAHGKRLIRSGKDAVDGIIAAIEEYGTRLRHDSPNDLDDLWNRPAKLPPTPKEEERISDKLCTAIREYFRDYAVTAGREVQISRRKLPRQVAGASGSVVDIFCSVPAAAAADGDPITVPVEVKLSHNREARTALESQLVARYMSELGTSFGVFAVVWMAAPTATAAYRPVWGSIDEARNELSQQATDAISRSGDLDVRSIVIDASLPTVTS